MDDNVSSYGRCWEHQRLRGGHKPYNWLSTSSYLFYDLTDLALLPMLILTLFDEFST